MLENILYFILMGTFGLLWRVDNLAIIPHHFCIHTLQHISNRYLFQFDILNFLIINSLGFSFFFHIIHYWYNYYSWNAVEQLLSDYFYLFFNNFHVSTICFLLLYWQIVIWTDNVENETIMSMIMNVC